MRRIGALLDSPVGRYGPPLALMAITFFLSAQPHLKTDLGWIDLLGRKIIHVSEFAALWLLWLRALGAPARPGVAAAVTIAYAVTDEFHQHFVAGRVGSPLDVAIDAIGVAVAWWIWQRPRARTAPSPS
jgi:VanZ family protein